MDCFIQACQKSMESNETYSLANYGSEMMRVDDKGDVFVHYSAGDAGDRYIILLVLHHSILSIYTGGKQLSIWYVILQKKANPS